MEHNKLTEMDGQQDLNIRLDKKKSGCDYHVKLPPIYLMQTMVILGSLPQLIVWTRKINDLRIINHSRCMNYLGFRF